MSDNNSSGGAMAPKSGDMAVPLKRGAGFSQTMGALGNQTKSPHQHDSKHYRYESVVSKEKGGNLHGWQPE